MDQHPPSAGAAYKQALHRERRYFESRVNVHDLPDIFHYWSQRYIQPKLLAYRLESPAALFGKYLKEICNSDPKRSKRFVSVGAGNCDLEIKVARELRTAEHHGFVIDCVDLNAAMLERGRAASAKAGVIHNLEFTEADFNHWSPVQDYDAVLAHQSLHHVLNLEALFEQVKRSLRPGGRFIISDMIGRNGHQRWPEALAMIDEFWRKLPPSYRFNTRTKRYEERFEDWDCSVEGFEGIRSQDILPLLLDTFHFQFFLPFANIIDPFVDRSFGPNFDATAKWDRAFIDEVHRRDESEILAGRLTPTHMLAVVVNEARTGTLHPAGLSPEFCVCKPDGSNRRGGAARPDLLENPYDRTVWSHSAEAELGKVCKRLVELSEQLANRESEIGKLTAWALDLEKQRQEHVGWALSLNSELQERTTWALSLQSELENRTTWALSLQSDLESRTTWALQLEKELEESRRALSSLPGELQERWPLRYRARRILGRVIRGVSRRLRRGT